MGDRVRLHLGCGGLLWPNWVNLDKEVDLKNLPFDRVDEICAIHLFEHLPRPEIDDYLSHWSDLLKDGGRLILEMPSLDKIARMHIDGVRDPQITALGIFGDVYDEDPYMRHQWCWCEDELRVVLLKYFEHVEFMEPTFHFPERDLRVEAWHTRQLTQTD